MANARPESTADRPRTHDWVNRRHPWLPRSRSYLGNCGPSHRATVLSMNVRPHALFAGSVAVLILASAGLPIAARAQATGSTRENRAASPERGGIVFTGSSIFQFWTRLTEQMAPLPVLNRAIAGTVTQDMLDRIGQLVLPYQPRIVVYYSGTNDISSAADS